MTNDILLPLGNGDVSFLTFLDLTSAFDTINHNILLHRNRPVYDIFGTVLSWFESYLTGMTQTVTVNGSSSRPADVFFGVLQGSAFGPIFFIVCSAPPCSLIETHSVSKQSFADDTQLLQSRPPDQIHATVLTTQTCISEVMASMTQNKLKLNDDKTEAFLMKSDRTNFHDAQPTSLCVSTADIPFMTCARNLGFLISDKMTFDKRV